jgi:stage II sporulation protein D
MLLRRFVLPGVMWLLLAGGCRRGEVAPAPSTAPATRMTRPEVRIGLAVDTVQSEIGASRAFEIRTLAGDLLTRSEANETWTFRVVEDDQLRASSTAGRQIGPAAAPLRILPLENGHITIGGKEYRGTALLRVNQSGRLSAINVVDIEAYLQGVVPFEIGRLAPELIAAVKAQAVAARTYAIGNLNRWEAQGFDFLATVQDQVYGGVSGEDSVTTRAVQETRGEIVTFQGKPILAYYSSTCGGRTANVEDAWPWRSPLPYLRSVSDSSAGSQRSYCETSSRFRWTVSWTRDSLRRILEQTMTARLGRPILITRINALELMGPNDSGRARALQLQIDGESHTVPGDSIRWVLRPDATRGLNSTLLFELNAHQNNGEVAGLEVRGGGWGHGVGMCQVGAIGRARAGHDYRDILAAYYSGTRVETVY